jgi:predicted aspartyl protease
MTISTISTTNIETITTTITVTNFEDEVLATHGYMPSEKIRSITINNAVVRTRTHFLCLPADVIAKLDLPFVEEIDVKTATGIRTVRLFKHVSLRVQGREALSRCIELSEDESAVLGLIQLEELGLTPDVDNQQLIMLPDTGKDSYHLAY